jgi:hypothetical protein
MVGYLANPDALHADRLAVITVQSEQPWHRLLLYFKSQGLSNAECAKRLDVTPVQVSTVSRQEWFRQRLVDLLKQEGLPAVQELIRGAAAESVLRLIELRDTAKSEALQADCAMDLLNRYLGKAPQIVSEGTSLAEVDEEQLDARIATLQKKIGSPAVAGDGSNGVN